MPLNRPIPLLQSLPKHRRAMPMVALCAGLFAASAFAQTSPPSPAPTDSSALTLHVETDTVLTNVVVRDAHTGALVTGLRPEDFTLLEDGKRQSIISFDYESMDRARPLNEATISGLASAFRSTDSSVTARPEQLHDHRLIVFFFDLTSMQPEDVERAVNSARNYIQHQMQPADLVALISLDTSLSIDQDFTADRNTLLAKVSRYNDTTGSSFAQGANADTNQVEDATGYTPDEEEYNDINTDRELFAIRTISRSLERINQRKSMLYFSGGLQRDGIENQASLRSAINAAVRANLAVYSIDTRGLQAISPLGDASTGSLRGNGAFSGIALQNNFNSNFDTQETLTTLAADTGGKAFLDSNDFSPAFAQVQQDTSAYYVLGYHSTNPRRDGHYRRITLRINRPGLRLDYRHGYYAPADFRHSENEDRERQLTEQLASDLPATDLPVYLDAYEFPLSDSRFDVPVSLLVPGSQIPFVRTSSFRGGNRDKATLDILGEVLDASHHPVGQVRQTVRLALDANQQPTRKNIQYTTRFLLPPGTWTLKFVVRENETGRMGSFETKIHLLEPKKQTLRLSSVLLASRIAPVSGKTAKSADGPDPLLTADGVLVPNITHVFRRDQHLHLLCEIDSPQLVANAGTGAKTPRGAVRILSSLELISGSAIAYQTPVVVQNTPNTAGRVAIEMDIPLEALHPGEYIAQLNIIDDAAGSYAFPRFAILLRDAAAASATAKPAP